MKINDLFSRIRCYNFDQYPIDIDIRLVSALDELMLMGHMFHWLSCNYTYILIRHAYKLSQK
jgi:hypothetical protein